MRIRSEGFAGSCVLVRLRLRLRLRLLLLPLVLVMVAAGCATNGGRNADPFATLTVQPARVAPGGPATLTLTNRSDQPLGYNLCPAALERQLGDDWEERPERPAEFCTMELRTLDPGASGTFEHTLPAPLPPGTYRFRVGVEWPLGEGWVDVVSEPFEVGA